MKTQNHKPHRHKSGTGELPIDPKPSSYLATIRHFLKQKREWIAMAPDNARRAAEDLNRGTYLVSGPDYLDLAVDCLIRADERQQWADGWRQARADARRRAQS